jgi:hypothetical protein
MSRLTNLELNDVNENNLAKLCAITQEYQSSLFEDEIPREIAITRFKIPINLMELMIIDQANDPDYLVQFENDISSASLIKNYTNIGTAYMAPTTLLKIYSPGDLVEAVNRAFMRAHRAIISNFTSFIKTSSFSNVGFITGGNTEGNFNISATGLLQTSYVKLTLSNYVLTSTAGQETALCNIDLASPGSSIICRVASAVLLESGKTYVFETGGVYTYSSVKRSDNTFDNSQTISPMESFLKYKNISPDGNWKLIIRTSGNNTILDIKLSATLEVCATPIGSGVGGFRYPNQPPIVDYDEKGFITWSVPEIFLYSDFRIKLGNKLKTILNYYKVTNDDSYVRFPIVVFSDNKDQILTFKQESPRLYNMVQCERLQISLFGFNIDRDSNNDLNPSSAITSFLLPSDEVMNFTEITYNTDSSIKPYRRYRMHSNNINRFTLSIEVVYKDGLRKPLFIESGSSWGLMLSIFEVS